MATETETRTNYDPRVLKKIAEARALVSTMDWPMDGKIELGHGKAIPYRSAESIKKNINQVMHEIGLEYVYNIVDVETLPGFGSTQNRLRGTFRLDIIDVDTGAYVTYSGPCEAGTSNDKASAFIHTNGYKALMSTVFGINTDDDSLADDPDAVPSSKFVNQTTKEAIKGTFESNRVGGTNVRRDPLFSAPKTPTASEVLKDTPNVTVIHAVDPVTTSKSDNVPTVSDKTKAKSPISESQKKVIANTIRRLALTLPADKIKEIEAERDEVFKRDDADEANQWNIKIRSLA